MTPWLRQQRRVWSRARLRPEDPGVRSRGMETAFTSAADTRRWASLPRGKQREDVCRRIAFPDGNSASEAQNQCAACGQYLEYTMNEFDIGLRPGRRETASAAAWLRLSMVRGGLCKPARLPGDPTVALCRGFIKPSTPPPPTKTAARWLASSTADVAPGSARLETIAFSRRLLLGATEGGLRI